MERIGFIGLGSIGAPMARCLIRAGYRVTVCDKSPKALEAFKEYRAGLTQRPGDLAGQEMIVVMVANDAQAEAVVRGPEGFLAQVDPARPPLVALMSTVLPQTTRSLAQDCAAKNVRLVDATVSGLPVVAEEGQLTIMVGGAAADLEAMRPVFEVLGRNIFHAGPLGCGDIAKLVNNIVGVTNLYLAVEAMLVAKGYGMDPARMAEIMEVSSGRCFATKDWERGRATFGYFAQSLELSQVLNDLCRKDLEHAQEMARGAGLSCPMLDHAVSAVQSFSPEEIKERWGEVSADQRRM